MPRNGRRRRPKRTRFELMRYYEFHSDLKGKDALILWYIEHEPGGKVRPWNINPSWDRAGYEHGKRLWQVNVKVPGASGEIYDRAARARGTSRGGGRKRCWTRAAWIKSLREDCAPPS